MRNKITAVTLLLLLALFAVVPAEAAFKTKLTLTIAPHSDIPSHEVSPDLLDERGIFTGSRTETRTFTDTQGRSVTETETEFRNVDGVLLMSADVEITARSEDFTVKSGEIFAENFSVDVTLSLNDRSYNEYQYTLGIEGLPEWLEVSGELLSADVLNTGITEHHHEFSVSGTPSGSFDAGTLRFTAVVYVSGDVPVMRVMASKDVRISAEIVPKPPEPEPSEPEPPAPVPKSDDISPDVVPKNSIETIEEDPGHSSGTGTGTRTLAEAVSHMTAEEKAAVKVIKVNSYITDLTGLEEFTNVERLDLKEAVSLQSFDLNGNSTVKSVDVSGNTGVKTLSLKGSKVENLDASGCGNLEEVDVSGCETLIILKVSDTPITKLDAEGCKNLEVLDCSYCNIVDLNITGCDSLNVLDCSNNSLARLDAYMFTRLSELMCYNQQITGWKIGTEFNFMDYFQDDTSSSSEVSAAVPDYGIENIVNLKAWDANGGSVAVEYDVDTGTAKFSVAPAKIAYDYITGFNDVLMDVTVFTVEDWPSGAENRPGGCNTEFAVSVLVLGMFLTMFKKRE